MEIEKVEFHKSFFGPKVAVLFVKTTQSLSHATDWFLEPKSSSNDDYQGKIVSFKALIGLLVEMKTEDPRFAACLAF